MECGCAGLFCTVGAGAGAGLRCCGGACGDPGCGPGARATVGAAGAGVAGELGAPGRCSGRFSRTSTATALVRPCEKLCRTIPLDVVLVSVSGLRPAGGASFCSLPSLMRVYAIRGVVSGQGGWGSAVKRFCGAAGLSLVLASSSRGMPAIAGRVPALAFTLRLLSLPHRAQSPLSQGPFRPQTGPRKGRETVRDEATLQE